MTDHELKSIVNNALHDFRVGDIVYRVKTLPGVPARIQTGAIGRVESISRDGKDIGVTTRGGATTITKATCFRHATVDEVNHYER